jgi:hypothetical protein|nr:MAG TPA: hypothetical protein [Caudoviricetes sp.]
MINKITVWIKEYTSKRQRYNKKVMYKLLRDLENEVSSNYWSKDISDYMVKKLTSGYPNGIIYRLISDAYNKLK